MAYHDTLFQLGMDLTRSSTAQKEDHGETAQVAHTAVSRTGTPKSGKHYVIEREGVRYAGNHLLIDVFGAKGVDNIQLIEKTLKRCVEVAGATLLHIHLHHSTPNGGVSGVAVLTESHISVHSWPEANYVAFDVFMGGNADPQRCVDVLREAFGASKVVVKPFKRGEQSAPKLWKQDAARSAPVQQLRGQKTKVRKAA